MRKILLTLLCFQCTLSIGQTISQLDSLTYKMCESFDTYKTLKEQERIDKVVQEHIPQFYQKFKVSSQKVADSIGERIFFRLQRNCNTFIEIMGKQEENKSDWTIENEKPKTEIASKECTNFYKGGNFYYKEYDGKIVNVVMTKSTWTETFEDQSFSKLVFIPKPNCEFDLEFIESNNNSRKNFSVKGDRYPYGLYKFSEGIYYVWTYSDQDKKYYGFRLYPKK